MTRPSAETNEPEPCGKRIDDFCTCSSHLSEMSKLYLSLRCLAGGLVNSHMPSSARAAGARSRAARSAPQVRRVIVSPLLEKVESVVASARGSEDSTPGSTLVAITR